eukprot:330938-Chlamydomonas_euryale.AAC.1
MDAQEAIAGLSRARSARRVLQQQHAARQMPLGYFYASAAPSVAASEVSPPPPPRSEDGKHDDDEYGGGSYGGGGGSRGATLCRDGEHGGDYGGSDNLGGGDYCCDDYGSAYGVDCSVEHSDGGYGEVDYRGGGLAYAGWAPRAADDASSRAALLRGVSSVPSHGAGPRLGGGGGGIGSSRFGGGGAGIGSWRECPPQHLPPICRPSPPPPIFHHSAFGRPLGVSPTPLGLAPSAQGLSRLSGPAPPHAGKAARHPPLAPSPPQTPGEDTPSSWLKPDRFGIHATFSGAPPTGPSSSLQETVSQPHDQRGSAGARGCCTATS